MTAILVFEVKILFGGLRNGKIHLHMKRTVFGAKSRGINSFKDTARKYHENAVYRAFRKYL